jgi:hypothetical protein
MHRLGLAAGMWAALAIPAGAYDITDPEVEKGQQKLGAIHVGAAGFPTGNTRNLQSLG